MLTDEKIIEAVLECWPGSVRGDIELRNSESSEALVWVTVFKSGTRFLVVREQGADSIAGPIIALNCLNATDDLLRKTKAE